ncbi:MAG: site-2 protease family protein [Methanobacteriaceae archaeon]|nr:site-2 protease family protein [Methanobacteriaceae archaeon]
MNVLWYYVIGFILIWIIALLFRDQLKIDVKGPLLMRKTKRMRGFIDKIANLSPRFWKWVTNIGLPVGVFFMAFMVFSLVSSLQTLFQAPQVALILPGVDLPGQPIKIPLLEGIIALATVMIVHEFGHGIIARVEGVRIKSIGVLLLAILPGAFVEPDEEEVIKVSRLSRLRIYVAGSIFNLGLAALCLIILIGLSLLAAPAFEADGMEIDRVVPKSPAEGFLKEGMIIQSINGNPTSRADQYIEIINQIKIGDTVSFQTNQGIFNIKAGKSPNNVSKAYIGIGLVNHLVLKKEVSKPLGDQLPYAIFPVMELLRWIYVLNLLVGAFNLLPMKPLDGGLIFEELLRYKLSESKVRAVANPISLILVIIIIVSVVYGTGRGIMMLF